MIIRSASSFSSVLIAISSHRQYASLFSQGYSDQENQSTVTATGVIRLAGNRKPQSCWARPRNLRRRPVVEEKKGRRVRCRVYGPVERLLRWNRCQSVEETAKSRRCRGIKTDQGRSVAEAKPRYCWEWKLSKSDGRWGGNPEESAVEAESKPDAAKAPRKRALKHPPRNHRRWAAWWRCCPRCINRYVLCCIDAMHWLS
jgi:hypothetical protein